jgi:hypothetical protein
VEGIIFKEIKKMNNYGYRIVLADNDETCIIYEKRDTREEKEILKIVAFNDMCKLRIKFAKDERVALADWIQIRPKLEKKGLMIFYEKDRLAYGKELLV